MQNRQRGKDGKASKQWTAWNGIPNPDEWKRKAGLSGSALQWSVGG